jgi:hypothetical protein
MKGSQKSIVTSDKGPRRFHPQAIRFLSCLLCLLVWSASVRAAITIEGVTDKKVYKDRVSFTIRSEAGFDYTAELTSTIAVTPVATDVPVEVNEPDYYELSVQRREEFRMGTARVDPLSADRFGRSRVRRRPTDDCDPCRIPRRTGDSGDCSRGDLA